MAEYKVLNPRNLPAGVPVLGYKGRQWREGDIFVRPREMPVADLTRLEQRGFLRRVSYAVEEGANG